MKIAIDTSPLREGHSDRGIGGYTKNLIEALETYNSCHSLYLFNRSNRIQPEADIIHYPYFDPFFLTLPIYSPKPTVVTVHDLIPIVNSSHFPKGLRGSIRWEIQKYSLKRKQRIITDSEYSKKDIERYIGFSKNNIDVIFLAPSLHPLSVPENFTKIRKQFGIKGTYLLYVGDVNWNKNIHGLLKAFSSFISSYASHIQLVLVGKAFLDTSLGETRDINRMMSEFQLSDRIIRTGFVEDGILSLLYTHAQALIQPSLYEGFGFPVLEAMSLGCPVVCSTSSSLPEIAGPSIMVDPKDFHSMQKGMTTVMSLSSSEREELIRKGRTWVDRFTWQKTAENTIRSYEKVLGRT